MYSNDPNTVSLWELVTSMSAVGALTAIGQLFVSHEPLTPRTIIGRTLTSTCLALAAGSVLLWVSDPNPLALIGASAALSALGTGFLERAIQKKLGIT